MIRRHELPFGAEIVEAGVRFRLWAPKAHAVAVALEGAKDPLPMAAAEGGWFALTTDAAKSGSHYRYVVDGTAVPDPASRYQPADVHGPSEVIDPRSHEWGDDAWRGRPWREIVLYELHVGAFSPRGDFAGVAERLDALVDLGVTAIELMPIADFPGRWNWGYDGVLLFAPDASYGRPEDLKRLVEACHRRGLAVFLDVVYNHFGPEGNYLGVSAPGFFTERHHTPWGAAINFDAAEAAPVRRFYIENALYWLAEFHLDGLRFDAVHAIVDDGPVCILTEIATAVRRTLGTERAIHLILENDRNEAWLLERAADGGRLYDAQWNDDLHHVLHVLVSGETAGYYEDYADRPVARLGRALAEGFVYQGEPSRHRGGARRGTPAAQLPPTAFVAFLQNHDQIGNNAFGHRLARVAPGEAVAVAAAIYLLSPQIPMLFMGEEWGADQPFPFFCDFAGDLAAKVRDGRRGEFAHFPAFRDAAARASIPDPCAPATFAGAKLDWSALQQPDQAAWRARYRALLALRRREIVPRLDGITGHAGCFTMLGADALVVAWRLGDGSRLTLGANFGRTPALLPEDAIGRLLYATAPLSGGRSLAPLSAAFFLDAAAPP